MLYEVITIDPSIEEASADLGADSNKTFRKITLPMIAPAFFSGLAFSFVKAMTAISAIIFVVSGKWNLITVAILGFVDNSQYAQAAAMSLLLVITSYSIHYTKLYELESATLNSRSDLIYLFLS